MLTRLNDTDFYRTLSATQGAVLVFFSSAACNSCRYWRTLLTELPARYHGIRVFEVDAGESMGLTQEYEVFHLPALFLFQDGHYHAPLQCEASLVALTGALDVLLAQPAVEAP